MVESRDRRQTVTRCMSCGDELVVIGKSGEPEAVCHRQKCRKAKTTTPIRPIGFVRIPEGIDPEVASKILEAVRNGKLSVDQYFDPYVEYRAIDGLIFIGPAEIEQCFLGPNEGKLFSLEPGWCPRIPLPNTLSVEILQKVAKLCKTMGWETVPILWLALPEVARQPTSLRNQYGWWGVPHDNELGGCVRKDTMYSNWFVKDKPDWSLEHAVTEPRWVLTYELPRWSTCKNWDNQQKEVKNRGLTVSPASRDHLMLDLVAIATGKRLRTTTWARTATICDGGPLRVDFSGDSSSVDQSWYPESAFDDVGVAVEGVPNSLEA